MNDDRTYKMRGGKTTRLCIIVTDYKENGDKDWKMMAADLSNINQLVQNLGFRPHNILRIHSQPSNTISNEIGKFCENKEIQFLDYIMTFILAYRNGQYYRTGNVQCNFEKFKGYFVGNILNKWAEKPKIIFHQAPIEKSTRMVNVNAKPARDSTNKNNQFNLPIATNIMEVFACNGHQDSYGNAAGSFYIQALCEIFNRRIENGSFYKTYLSEMMYEVHNKVRESLAKVKAAKPTVVHGDQTPYVNSTFVKQFLFPK